MIPLSFLQYVYPFHHGRKKLLGLLRRTCGRLTMTRSVFGDYMLIDRFNYVDHQVLLHGGYETEQIRNFLNKIEQISAEIFIDIGANLGVYCLPARRLKCLEKVMAFEPDDRNFKQLSGNIFLNDHNGKIEARMEAVGDRNGMVDFFVQRSDKDFGGSVSRWCVSTTGWIIPGAPFASKSTWKDMRARPSREWNSFSRITGY